MTTVKISFSSCSRLLLLLVSCFLSIEIISHVFLNHHHQHTSERRPKKSIQSSDNRSNKEVPSKRIALLFKGTSIVERERESDNVKAWICSSLPDLTITKMVEVLKTQIQSGASPSRIIALSWVHHLFESLQDKVRHIFAHGKQGRTPDDVHLDGFSHRRPVSNIDSCAQRRI